MVSGCNIKQQIKQRRVQSHKTWYPNNRFIEEQSPGNTMNNNDSSVQSVIKKPTINTVYPNQNASHYNSLSQSIIFLYHAKSSTVNIISDMGDRLININQLAEDYSEEHISALLALHAFTSADCTWAFIGKGKVRPMKILNQNSNLTQIFAEVGNSSELNEQILSGVDKFTRCLYGFSCRIKNVDEAREIKVKKMCGSNLELQQGISIDLSTFPSCKRVLLQHTTSFNFQVCVCKRAHKHYPGIPSPLNHGFQIKRQKGKLPLQFEGDVTPKPLSMFWQKRKKMKMT